MISKEEYFNFAGIIPDLVLTDKNYDDFVLSHDIKMKFIKAQNVWDRYAAIREMYDLMLPKLIERYRVEPNFLPWSLMFTPIEDMAWQEIRYIGLPVYPQYPVGKYFLDFGSPKFKIGIELDGKEFHKDYKKDLARDEELLQLGWKIFRIEGKECYTEPTYFAHDEYHDGNREYMYNKWLNTTVGGVLECIDMVYFRGREFEADENYKQSLRNHKLANFEI